MEKADLQPTLSIIVPILNETEQLPDLLDHLRLWQHKGCQVILVDGGSDDGSAELAANMGFAVLSAPAGRARQMNAGAEQADGAVLLFLHADTRLPAEADTLIMDALVTGKRRWGRFDVRIGGKAFMLRVVSWFMNRRSRLTGIATGDQALFVARQSFNLIGGFHDQPLMEDIDLCRRLRCLTPPVCLRQQVISSGRRWENNGMWKTIWLMWQLRWAYWRGTQAAVLAERYQ